jgi:hypothetical protein
VRARINHVPEYLAPGVYVEETSYRSKSIEGVSTITRGFFGTIRRGGDTIAMAAAVLVLGVSSAWSRRSRSTRPADADKFLPRPDRRCPLDSLSRLGPGRRRVDLAGPRAHRLPPGADRRRNHFLCATIMFSY